MLSRVRLILVSVLLFASVAVVPTPVFGADGNNNRSSNTGAQWTPLDAPQDSWRAMAKRAEPIRYRPQGVPANAAWATEEEEDALPFFVKATKPVRRFRSGSTATAEAPNYQIGPINYTRTEITDPTQSPFIQHGKLFIDFPSGSAVCSGTIVTSMGEDMVLTAGHCLEDPTSGEASIGAVFVPGYRNNTAPAGGWAATGYATTDQWAASYQSGGDPRFDIGVLQIPANQDGSGLSLQDRFGSRGAMFNLTFEQQFDSYGYPAAPGTIGQNFDGELLWTCASDVGFQDMQFPGPPFTTGMGCDMTGGSSGGGWIINDQFLNSVVSYGIEGEPEVQYGPYFGTTAQAFYEEYSGIDQPDPEPGGDHEMALSLRLRKHLIAKGRLTAVDGYTPCASGAPIGVFKFVKRTQSFKFLKETATSSTGTWKIRLRDRTGHYAALAPEGPVDEQNFCLEAISGVKRHRH